MTIFLQKLMEFYPIPKTNSFEVYKDLFHTSLSARELRSGKIILLDFLREVELKLERNYNFNLFDLIDKSELSNLWFDQYQTIEGMIELIHLLKKNNHKIGIISANFKERFEHVFTKGNLISLFDEDLIYLTYLVGYDKGDLNFYRHVFKDLEQKTDFDEYYYIEDKIKYISLAESAGIKNSLLFDYEKGEDLNNVINQLLKIKRFI